MAIRKYLQNNTARRSRCTFRSPQAFKDNRADTDLVLGKLGLLDSCGGGEKGPRTALEGFHSGRNRGVASSPCTAGRAADSGGAGAARVALSLGRRPAPLQGRVWAGARRPLGPILRAGSRRESAPSRLFPLPRSPPKRRGSFHPPPRSGRFAPRPRRTAASPPSAPSLGRAARRAAASARRAASPPAASSTHERNASRVEIGAKAEPVRLRRPATRPGSRAESDVAS